MVRSDSKHIYFQFSHLFDYLSVLASVRPNPNGSAERSAEIDRTGSAERSVNLAEPRTSQKYVILTEKIGHFHKNLPVFDMNSIFQPSNV